MTVRWCKIRFSRLNIGGYHTDAYIYLCKNIIGGLNIGDFIQKLPIAKIYSSPIFYLIRYILAKASYVLRRYYPLCIANKMECFSDKSECVKQDRCCSSKEN